MIEFWILRKNGGTEYKTKSRFEYYFKRLLGWDFVRKGMWAKW